ncbi:MAG TPA: type II toxin-antitoxin system HicA family toxin [Bacteroidota bacterium]|nr:type II toxin-antitoxin system HicA family toxin [Bacteroidota bacterium]
MLRSISLRELITKFRSLGFDGPFPGGRHQFMRKGALKIRIPNPHRGDIDVSLLKRILRQANISEQEWESA